MALGLHRAYCDRMQVGCKIHPFRTGKSQDQLVTMLDQEGCDQHGQHNAGDAGLLQRGIDQRVLNSQRQDDEGEFTTLTKGKAGTPGTACRSAEQAGQARDQRCLERYQKQYQQQYQPPLGNQNLEVQGHSHRDKKQAQQQVAKRTDIVLHLIAEVCFRDQHACEKSTQCQRQSCLFGQPGNPERNQQQIEHEQFAGVLPGNQVEPGAHQALAQIQQHHQYKDDLEGGDAQSHEHGIAVAAENRQYDQQRHHGQVLEQQDADCVLAVR